MGNLGMLSFNNIKVERTTVSACTVELITYRSHQIEPRLTLLPRKVKFGKSISSQPRTPSLGSS